MISEHIHGVLAHKRLVAYYLRLVASDLIRRAVEHDDSKFTPEELDAFERMTPILKTLTYGTDAYRDALKELGPALDHHYLANDHHPEHFKDGIEAMSLVQLLEMVCDWMAATARVKDGDIRKSLDINQERFKISPQLFSVLKNTVESIERMPDE